MCMECAIAYHSAGPICVCVYTVYTYMHMYVHDLHICAYVYGMFDRVSFGACL